MKVTNSNQSVKNTMVDQLEKQLETDKQLKKIEAKIHSKWGQFAVEINSKTDLIPIATKTCWKWD